MEDQAGNTQQAVTQKPHRSRKGLYILVVVVAVLLLATYFICGITHREGTHTGLLTRVERTGFLFKTYEGEMRISGVNEGRDTIMQPRFFAFSVKQDSVYRSLEPLQGERVSVRYREVLHNFFWQGKTNFFVDAIVVPETK